MTRDVTLTLAVDTGPLADQLTSLKAEIEALRADRDRLDYLERDGCGVTRLAVVEGSPPLYLAWGTGLPHETLRAAIDAKKGGAA